MRYLSWDEVKSLDKFLVEDNDDAIGIEIQTGHYDLSEEVCYGKPETVKAHSLEELAGGEFLQMGTKTLRAVVSNRLYYTDSRNFVDNTGTYAVCFGAGNEYKRAVLTFRVSCRVPRKIFWKKSGISGLRKSMEPSPDVPPCVITGTLFMKSVLLPLPRSSPDAGSVQSS